MATHSSILAWRIPWTEEPGGLQSRAGHKSRDTTEATEHVCTGLRQHRGSPQQLGPQREGATLEVRVPSERIPEVYPVSVTLQPDRPRASGTAVGSGPPSGLGAV